MLGFRPLGFGLRGGVPSLILFFLRAHGLASPHPPLWRRNGGRPKPTFLKPAKAWGVAALLWGRPALKKGKAFRNAGGAKLATEMAGKKKFRLRPHPTITDKEESRHGFRNGGRRRYNFSLGRAVGPAASPGEQAARSGGGWLLLPPGGGGPFGNPTTVFRSKARASVFFGPFQRQMFRFPCSALAPRPV